MDPQGNGPSEMQLLRLCARTRLDASRRQRVASLLQYRLDWSQFFALASRHAVSPLVYHCLSQHDRVSVPEELWEDLRSRYRKNALHNVILARELTAILDVFAAEQLPAVPFKGPALAAAAYGNLNLRQFNDLDIFIHREDLARAAALLESRGYRLDLDEAEQAHELRHHYHFHFVRGDVATSVELHWAFAPAVWPLALDARWLWGDYADVDLCDRRVRCFRPECALVLLCVHGAKERWSRLQLVADVAEQIRAHPGLDWDSLLDAARRMRRERIVALGLALAAELLEAPLPAEATAFARSDGAVGRLVCRIASEAGWPPRHLAANRYFFTVWNGPGDRRRYAWYLLTRVFIGIRRLAAPNEKDRELFRLPGPLRFLAPLVRPLRLLRTYGTPSRLAKELRERL